ncbi:MAG: ASKHA domain-containing protein [Syntrophomonadaceae bacterium]|nr:ASKHA domain-containing protein [Syntrophomonadaceae bacterium]
MTTDTIRVTLKAPDGQEVQLWAPVGKRLWDVIAGSGWYSRGSCGGQGTCGKCKVKVEGPVSALTASEHDQLMPDELRSSWRLACAARAEGDVTVYMDRALDAGPGKGKISLLQRMAPDSSYIRNINLLIPGQQPDYPRPLWDRLQSALPEGVRLAVSLDDLRELNALDRPNRPALELQGLLVGDELCRIGTRRQQQRLLGLALDVGSTSLLAVMADLESGEIVGINSRTNMQRVYGEDIISRISYGMEQPQGHTLLHQILVNQLNGMSAELLPLAGENAAVMKICAVGNPVMLHFLLGLPVNGFAAAPYNGIFSGALECKAADADLDADALAQLYIPPQLGGFVGADAAAGLLALPPGEEDKYMFIDIGTNGEIVLYHEGRYYAASAAAGPAFEGAGITCGMRAAAGAIDHWHMEEGRLVPAVIGGGPVKGICGSGLIELLALLLDEGLIDGHGIISESAAAYELAPEGTRGRCLVLVAAEDNAGMNITIDQEDIRNLQMSKSALRTAIELLLQDAKLRAEQLNRIYLAGVFGSCISSEAAVRIGLLPDVKRERIINIGNAAAVGALKLLLGDGEREAAANVRRDCTAVELANKRDFQQRFIENLDFPAAPAGKAAL